MIVKLIEILPGDIPVLGIPHTMIEKTANGTEYLVLPDIEDQLLEAKRLDLISAEATIAGINARNRFQTFAAFLMALEDGDVLTLPGFTSEIHRELLNAFRPVERKTED